MNALLSEFVDYLQNDKKVARNTLQSYTRDIKQFSDFIESRGIEVENVKGSDLESYIAYMQFGGKAPSSVSRSASSVRALYDYLHLKGFVEEVPTYKLRTPKAEKKLPQILTTSEVNVLLKSPDLSTDKGVRDKAMLELLYATGIKVSELISINRQDVDLDFGYIRCARKQCKGSSTRQNCHKGAARLHIGSKTEHNKTAHRVGTVCKLQRRQDDSSGLLEDSQELC